MTSIASRAIARRAAVFLDLHGTLGLVADIPRFAWYRTAAPAVQVLNRAGLLAIVVTNQPAIGLGRLTLEEFWLRMRAHEQELREVGATLDAIYCCPHLAKDHCTCGKPGTALIDQACRDFPIDVYRSYVVGDRGDLDILLAAAIGARAILVRTGQGKGSLGRYRGTWAEIEADYVASNVLAAVHWIVRQASYSGRAASLRG